MDLDLFARSPIGSLERISGTDGRSGVPYEYSAYVPFPLAEPPALTGSTMAEMLAAERALAALNSLSALIPNPELLRRPTLRREAQSTSALEGTFAPLQQVLEAEADDRPARTPQMVEILNYVAAASQAFDWIRQRPRITTTLLELAHGSLVRGTSAETADAGRIRTCQVAIGGPGGSIDQARFVPMPPGPALAAALQDLTDWIASTRGCPPLVAAAMAHYQFETLHPFNDGNGRIGRLMIVLHLMVSGILSEPMLSVSPWFELRRSEYQDQLAQVTITGDWQPWIQFFCSVLSAAAQDTQQRALDLRQVREQYLHRVENGGIRGGLALGIIDELIGQPIVTVPGLARRFDRSPQAVAQALKRLVALGVLAAGEGSYVKRYRAPEVLAVLTRPIGN